MSEKTVFVEVFEDGESVYKEKIIEPLSDNINMYTLCLAITGLLVSINKGEND